VHIVCRLLGHRFYRYGSRETVPPCAGGLACERCREFSYFTAGHDFKLEFESTQSCTLVRVCRACGFRDVTRQVRHEFGEWRDEPRQCRSVRRCIRCQSEESSRKDCCFGPVSVTGCVSRRVCEMCGQEERTEHHDFEKTASTAEVFPDCTVHHVIEHCRRCAQEKQEAIPVYTGG
jgi:hypothetical protein